ncbi:50S ribosomal protein L28 [bacterium]|nr:50S ribosomal protein L28 [bacterium]MCP5461598.1 50S ribosomal protein L28 [bacterium]
MSKICGVCGKGPQAGRTIARRGLAKKKGGVGKNITGVTKRRFLPNLQSIKVLLNNGTIKRMKVCASCIRGGKIAKP